MAKRGRKTKYCEEIVQEIEKYLEMGLTIRDICDLLAINPDTFFEWQKKHPEFSERVKKAEAKCKARNIQIIQKAAINSWQAAAWWLERKHANEFKNIQQVESPNLNITIIPADKEDNGNDKDKSN